MTITIRSTTIELSPEDKKAFNTVEQILTQLANSCFTDEDRENIESELYNSIDTLRDDISTLSKNLANFNEEPQIEHKVINNDCRFEEVCGIYGNEIVQY